MKVKSEIEVSNILLSQDVSLYSLGKAKGRGRGEGKEEGRKEEGRERTGKLSKFRMSE